MDTSRIDIPRERLAEFCRKWKVAELSLFGSALREDFGPESDVDVLVTFEPDARPTLFSLQDIEAELAAMFGRPVDVVTRRSIEQSRNPVRRREILSSSKVVYAA